MVLWKLISGPSRNTQLHANLCSVYLRHLQMPRKQHATSAYIEL